MARWGRSDDAEDGMKIPIHKAWVWWAWYAAVICLGLALNGCASVEKTMSAVDYACVDIEMDAKTSDSGILGRGVVLPEGETLTAETIDLLCNY
jgi:hypothetical protein